MSILTDLGYGGVIPSEVAPINERATKARISLGAKPPTPEIGYSPFTIATILTMGAVDWSALASGLFALPVASSHAVPTKGTASSLPLSDHDHGLVKGPPLVDLAVTFASPGQPDSVIRTDTPGGVVSSTVITWTGSHVASVVTTRTGYSITVTPTYAGGDIAGIERVVA